MFEEPISRVSTRFSCLAKSAVAKASRAASCASVYLIVSLHTCVLVFLSPFLSPPEIDIVDPTTGTVREAQLSRFVWWLPAEHDDNRARYITVTMSADGSFPERPDLYGMIG